MEKTYSLEGIKVVDFSWIFTGPIVTKFLGDHGAEVIRIESSARPDDARTYTPFKDGIPGMNRSGVFANYNSSKFSITLNLTHPRGIELARKLVVRSDVVIEAFRPGTIKRWGLDYEKLKEVKSDIIMVSMSLQGQYGPFALQPSFGAFFQSTMGFTHVLGWPDREPAVPPTPYPDFIGPWFILVAIMTALDYRRRTGKGQYIDLSQLETGVHFLAPTLLDYTINNRDQTRQGNSSTRAAPHGAYRCRGKDRWCAIAVFNDEEWEAFCRIIGNPAWTQDPRFATLLGRTENGQELDKLVEAWTINYSAEEVMNIMQTARVAAGVVQNGEDLVDKDAQLNHRQHFWKLDHPEMGSHISEAPPFRLTKTPAAPQMPAPSLGEHTHYVCTQILGMSDEEFVEMEIEGVFH